MITITISGEQGEGKTRLMRLIFKLLQALEYDIVTEKDRCYQTPDIYICTRQVKAKV